MVRTPLLKLIALLALTEAIYLRDGPFRCSQWCAASPDFSRFTRRAVRTLCRGLPHRTKAEEPPSCRPVGGRGGAVLFRLTLLPAGLPHDTSWRAVPGALRADLRGVRVSYERFLLFDSDVWRYLWDGHVWAHGVNPYLHAPADPELDAWADEGDGALTNSPRRVGRHPR